MTHHTAGVGVRELLTFTPDELAALLAAEHGLGRTFLLLSTCNRCELYWTGSHDYETWFRQLAEARGIALSSELLRLEGEEAVRHIFTVTAGLDSQILGETEVLGQVRRAYDAARAAGTTDRQMDAVFSAALATGRRVRRDTLLGRHPSSVSSSAVELAASEGRSGLTHRPIVVLGAGEAAEGVLRSLHQHGAREVALVNRSRDRARVLAGAWGATAHGWDELPGLLRTAELLFVATSAAHPVLSAGQLADAVADRSGLGSLAVMDLSVPRNVDPSARSVRGIRLYDLDDLQRLCCPAAGTPALALRDAEQLLEAELARLNQELRARAAAPQLAELHRHGAEVAEQEAAWALAQLDTLTEREQRVVKEMAERLVRRVLYPVSRSIRTVGDAVGERDGG